MELMLFRIKVFRPQQSSLWDTGFSAGSALRDAIEARPTSRRRRGVAWHIGNLVPIGTDGLYCRLGKMSKRTLPMYDERTGDFVEQELANAPYTHILVDWQLELCAIARNVQLAATPNGIARRLADVLNDDQTASEQRLTFRVGPVRNPDEFLALLGSAHSIRSFTFSFTRKNLFDSQKDFVEPFERFVDEAKAADGKVTVTGQDLASAPLREIAASAAATGDDASAKLHLQAGDLAQRRALRGDAAIISVDDLDTDAARAAALERARREHDRIRNAGGDAS